MKQIFTLYVTSKPAHLSRRYFFFWDLSGATCTCAPALAHATLPCEHTSDVAVGEQTQRLKSRKVGLAKQESKQRRDFTQMPDTTASLPEKPEEGGGSRAVEKQEVLPSPMEKAALVCTGNFPSESHPALESRLVILLRVRSAHLISWKLSPTFRSGLSQHSFSSVQS